MRIPTGKTSRQLDVNRDIAATFIFSYLIENSTILRKIVRINAARDHLRAMEEEKTTSPDGLFFVCDRNHGSADVLLTSLPGTFLPFTHALHSRGLNAKSARFLQRKKPRKR